MPNDAKLGLVVGMSLVIATGVLFFRKDMTAPEAAPEAVSAVSANPAEPAPTAVPRGTLRPVRANPAARTEEPTTDGPVSLQHTVKEGDTLFSLAKRYYGDADKFAEIYRVNRQVLKSPEDLTPGTVLVIPDAPASTQQEPEDK